MKIKMCLAALMSLLVCACGPSSELTPEADLILYNAKVYSLDWADPAGDGTPAPDAPYADGQWQADAEAVVIVGGQIEFVGATQQALSYQGQNSQAIDLDGATVIPGLIDSHVHVGELGDILQRINLIDVATPAEAIAKLRKSAPQVKPGEWIIGQGWDEGAWADQYPNRSDLDAVFPNNPVVLKSLHGFAVWANSQALQLAGIDRATVAPVGGEILREQSGDASGILLNRATTLLLDKIPSPSVESYAQTMRLGMLQMAQDGFVAVHEAGAESLHMSALEQLQADAQLPIRMYAMLSARDEALSQDWAQRGPHSDPSGFLDVRSVKAYYDGALGSRGARLLEDYSDQPGHRGVSGDGYGFNPTVVSNMIDAGFQVAIHAIGDAGNRETLDFLEQHQDVRELRHRIEHAQIISDSDFSRFKRLNVIASMEPPHAVEDKTWAEQRLGPERILGAYAWRTLRRSGVDLTFNSDLPGSDHSIFYGLHAAVTRRDKNAEPNEGWYPDQALTIEESLRAYTSWAAYSAFRENDTGVLATGKWADITVMDIDPFEAAVNAPEQLLGGAILMTVVNGKIVHQRLGKELN